MQSKGDNGSTILGSFTTTGIYDTRCGVVILTMNLNQTSGLSYRLTLLRRPTYTSNIDR